MLSGTAALSRGAGAYEVRALLKLGASPHAAFLDKGALALAARGGSAGVIDALLQAGAHLDGKDARGWTPLMHAIDAHGAESRAHVIVHLLDAGAAVDVWGQNLEGPLDLLEKKQREQARRRDGNQGKTNELSLLVAQKSSCKRLSVHAEGPHSPGSLKTSPEIAYTAAAPAPTIVLGGDEETTAARHSLSPRVDAAAGLPPAYRSCASGEAHSPRPAAIAPISPTGGGGFLGSGGLPPPLRDDLTSAERVSGLRAESEKMENQLVSERSAVTQAQRMRLTNSRDAIEALVRTLGRGDAHWLARLQPLLDGGARCNARQCEDYKHGQM